MQIRHAIPEQDAAACLAIYTPFVTDSAVSFDEVPPTLAEFTEKIRHLSETHAFLIADDGDGVAGYAYAAPYRERVAYRWAAEVSVYVAADRRHQGLGRRLYEALLALMAQQGYRVAIAGITQPNDASMALHMSLGFAPVGIFRRIGFKQGAWRDVAFLELELPFSGDRDAPPETPGPPVSLPT